MPVAGSSPRSWGTGPRNKPRPNLVRIIPTLVGNGFSPFTRWPDGSDHPHARGERPSPRLSFKGWLGSSPRSWGTDVPQRPRPNRRRIIPTLVGNGASTSTAATRRSDHPHARGERALHVRQRLDVRGSSPRSWGTGGRSERDAEAARIIPTLVGNGSGAATGERRSSDHPHARGERRQCETAASSSSGSSPRSWGTALSNQKKRRALRIIPTLVGNGGPGAPSPSRATDHPHARGERVALPHARQVTHGSSPRSWGTGRRARCAVPLCRIIPTLVGNGRRLLTTPPPAADHPHARGERPSGTVSASSNYGSSPRSWGTDRPGETYRLA